MATFQIKLKNGTNKFTKTEQENSNFLTLLFHFMTFITYTIIYLPFSAQHFFSM
jgi:hypothetical protein